MIGMYSTTKLVIEIIITLALVRNHTIFPASIKMSTLILIPTRIHIIKMVCT